MKVYDRPAAAFATETTSSGPTIVGVRFSCVVRTLSYRRVLLGADE